jgi:hypothetical protein
MADIWKNLAMQWPKPYYIYKNLKKNLQKAIIWIVLLFDHKIQSEYYLLQILETQNVLFIGVFRYIVFSG